MAMVLDVQASSFTVRTRAEGMFSRLAHDLEIAANDASADIEVEGERWRATVRFPLRSLQVVGVLRGDQVDRGVLSKKDRGEIERRISEEIVRQDVVVEASGESRTRGEARIRIGERAQRIPLTLTVEPRRDGELAVEGRGFASLQALGIREVKGPLGAFRVSDAIELRFWAMVLSSS